MQASIAVSMVLAMTMARPAPVGAEAVVRMAGDRVDVVARNVPLSDVLEQLAEQTGMNLVYDGPRPDENVTVSLLAMSPVAAVKELLHQRRVSYALTADPSGRVRTLILTKCGGPVAAPPAAAESDTPLRWLSTAVAPPPAPEATPAALPSPLAEALSRAEERRLATERAVHARPPDSPVRHLLRRSLSTSEERSHAESPGDPPAAAAMRPDGGL